MKPFSHSFNCCHSFTINEESCQYAWHENEDGNTFLQRYFVRGILDPCWQQERIWREIFVNEIMPGLTFHDVPGITHCQVLDTTVLSSLGIENGAIQQEPKPDET